jgi:PKD repeat protein
MMDLSELISSFKSKFKCFSWATRFLFFSILVYSYSIKSGLSQNFSSSVQYRDNPYWPNNLLSCNILGDLLPVSGFELIVSHYVDRGHGSYSYYNNIISKPSTVATFPDNPELIRFFSIGLIDYNNDGILDVLQTGDRVLGGNARTFLYRNNGNSTFSKITTQILNFSEAWQDWADYDSDGDYDLIISGKNTNYGTITKIYRNDLNDVFTEVFSSLQYTGPVAWFHYDNDGYNECIIGNKILKNSSSGVFQRIDTLKAAPGELAVGDYNMDGIQDIVCGYQIVLRSPSNPSVNSVVSSLDNTNSKNSWADCDNDGDLDLLHGGKLYRNDGNNVFTLTSYTSYTNGIWIDYDANLTLDIWSEGSVFLNAITADVPPGMPDSLKFTNINNKISFSWFGATDAQTNSAGLTYNMFLGSYPNGCDIISPMSDVSSGARKIIDFGNMGHRKSFILNKELPEGKYYWGVQTIDNSFAVSGFKQGPSFEIKKFTLMTVGGSGVGTLNNGLFFLDLDNDDDLDYFSETGTNFTSLWQNSGSNLFSTLSSLNLRGAFDVLDFNKDGILDISAGNGASIYDGKNKVINPTNVSKTGYTSWGDFNNDGFDDIAVDKYIIKNNSNLSFSIVDSLSSNGIRSWIDFDNDKDLDLLMGEYLFKNEKGKFQLQNTIAGASIAHAWGDIDNDGDQDLAAGNKIYINNNSVYSPLNLTLSTYNASSITWNDFNNDGYSDLLFLNRDQQIFMMFYNEGNYNFLPVELEKPTISGSFHWEEFSVGDTDNDGDADILLIGYLMGTGTGRVAYLYVNNSAKPNHSPLAPSVLKSTLDGFDIMLSWDKAQDQESNNEGLTYNIRVGTVQGGTDIISPMSNKVSGYRRIPEMGNIQSNLGWRIKNLPEGTYYWSVQAIDQSYAGGSWALEQTFTITRVSANFTADTICQGTPTRFNDLSLVTGGTVDRWKWYFGDGDSSSIRNPLHTYHDGGVYSVTLRAYYGSYQHSITRSILVKHKPLAAFTAQTVCEGVKTSFINSSNLDNITNPVWKWIFGDGDVSSVSSSVDHAYLESSVYIAKLIIIADNGCSDTIQKSVVVAKYPVAAITSNASLTFCNGDSITLAVSYTPEYNYTWKVDGSNLTGGDSSRFVSKLTGNYSVDVVNPVGSCTTTSSPVTVNVRNAPASPLISASRPLEFCQGDSAILSVTNITGYTYLWKLNGGAVGANSYQYIAKNAGVYNIVVSNSNNCSVSSSNSVNVVVNSLPSLSAVSLSGPGQFCQGGSITMNIPSNTGYSYNWRNENGLILDANTNSYTANKSGVYQLDISNSSGCVVKTIPVNVVVKPVPLKPAITSDNYQPGKCLGENPVRLNVGQTVTGYNYQWYKNGIPVNSTTSSYLEGFLSQGDYSVEANLDGCKLQSDNFNVFFADAPEKPQIYAQGPTLWYLACSNDSASAYKWYYNGILVQGADKYLYVANQKLGKYNVSISNTKGCYTLSDTITIPKGITGIDDLDPFAGLKIYPNPTPGLFTIEMDNQVFGELIINILTQEGKRILNIKFEKTTEHFLSQIDLSGQPKGLYLINLLIDKYLANRKVIVE